MTRMRDTMPGQTCLNPSLLSCLNGVATVVPPERGLAGTGPAEAVLVFLAEYFSCHVLQVPPEKIEVFAEFSCAVQVSPLRGDVPAPLPSVFLKRGADHFAVVEAPLGSEGA